MGWSACVVGFCVTYLEAALSVHEPGNCKSVQKWVYKADIYADFLFWRASPSWRRCAGPPEDSDQQLERCRRDAVLLKALVPKLATSGTCPESIRCISPTSERGIDAREG